MKKCPDCSAEIIEAIKEDGSKILLDKNVPIYEYTPLVDETLKGLRVRRSVSAYVPHFWTCSGWS